MSQELHILQCYSCETFQVHIVKKNNKWDCKICGESQSIKKVFGRGSGKNCRAHVQRLNEEKRRKETFVLNRGIKLQGAEHVVNSETNIRSVTSSKWQKYLSEEEEDCSDDSVMHPSEIRIGGKANASNEQIIKNYSASSHVNSVCGENIDVSPGFWSEMSTHLNETTYKKNENLPLQDRESSLRYSTAESGILPLTDNISANYDDYELDFASPVCHSPRNSSQLCFTLLPETSETSATLNCDGQQEIASDMCSNTFTSDKWNTVFGKKQLSATEVRDSMPPKDQASRPGDERGTGQLQSNIHGSHVIGSGTKARNSTKNIKQIFSDNYNEDELDEILKF